MVTGTYLNGLTEIIFIAILVESECYSAPFQRRCTVEQMHLRRGTLYFVLAVKTTPVYRQNNQSCKLSTATRHQLDLHSILSNKPFWWTMKSHNRYKGHSCSLWQAFFFSWKLGSAKLDNGRNMQFAQLSFSKLDSDRSLYLNPVWLIFVRDQANWMVLTASLFKLMRLSTIRL